MSVATELGRGVAREAGVRLDIPRDGEPEAVWRHFESAVADVRASGRQAILLRAASPVTPNNLERLRRIMARDEQEQPPLHWLVIDDVVLARRTNADGVVFTKPPAPMSYSRTREVLGSSRFIAEMVSSMTQDASEGSVDRGEVDLLIVTEGAPETHAGH